MPLLKHPTAGTIVNVSDVRANTLRRRGYTEPTAEDLAPAQDPPGAVQPQPPIDARTDQPEPPIDTRPDDLIGSPPIDMRPPNPLPMPQSVEEADGAGLDEESDSNEDDGQELEQPAKSAKKADWVAYAQANGVEDADSLTKDELVDRFAD